MKVENEMEKVTGITDRKKRKGAKMDITFWKIAGTILVFILIIATGFWLSNTGRPLSSGIFAAHKLISVAAIVVLSVNVYRIHKVSGLSTSELISVISTGVLFLGTVATGGLLSTDKVTPAIILRMHQVLPFLTTLSTGVTLFFLK